MFCLSVIVGEFLVELSYFYSVLFSRLESTRTSVSFSDFEQVSIKGESQQSTFAILSFRERNFRNVQEQQRQVLFVKFGYFDARSSSRTIECKYI